MSKQTTWETTTYGFLKGHIKKETLFRILRAKTPEEQQKVVAWIKNNGVRIIKKFQQEENLYNEALTIFK